MRHPAANDWPLIARLQHWESRLAGNLAGRGRFGVALYEFFRFGVKQAWACLFGGLMCALLLATHWWYPSDAVLARYDFLTLAAFAIQAVLLALRMETWDEARVILMFHVVGTCMEIFKTAAGSWVYPEPSVLRIGGVPLFTGFMYAAVGSYLARVWRLFDFRFRAHPPLAATAALSVLIYVNFFAHHFVMDFRWALFALTGVLFARTWVYFRIWRDYRRMPLLLGFVLVALFIWFAENIGTFANAWRYPNQAQAWQLVSIAKLGSWFLLMIISYVMVSVVNRPRPIEAADLPAADGARPASNTSLIS
ncbi:DUF817 domain-containing protein [Achromobacter arsenitoxydans]|uniref:DUF817 domain-containing protein n=1 Tax=Achromobacter arsenitoxydans SY8 TaxID=477184 RepID=H0F931_9BURK|nr:DUF817 domain-containing protein [Achromobacter arsenitoxydans]EHK65096.1 hypothetical protein KYC_16397 [Achromobacter arsenitoxydans SY8]